MRLMLQQGTRGGGVGRRVVMRGKGPSNHAGGRAGGQAGSRQRSEQLAAGGSAALGPAACRHCRLERTLARTRSLRPPGAGCRSSSWLPGQQRRCRHPGCRGSPPGPSRCCPPPAPGARCLEAQTGLRTPPTPRRAGTCGKMVGGGGCGGKGGCKGLVSSGEQRERGERHTATGWETEQQQQQRQQWQRRCASPASQRTLGCALRGGGCRRRGLPRRAGATGLRGGPRRPCSGRCDPPWWQLQLLPLRLVGYWEQFSVRADTSAGMQSS